MFIGLILAAALAVPKLESCALLAGDTAYFQKKARAQELLIDHLENHANDIQRQSQPFTPSWAAAQSMLRDIGTLRLYLDEQNTDRPYRKIKPNF